ncbi:MAG: YceI family protein [Bacteroidetes bacterium]|nr:YceI family protein [Bacteroidota bacterium]
MKTIRIFILILFLAGISNATELHVDKNRHNLVKFISDAPIEDFEGITENIDGYMYYEGEDLLKDSQIYFEVDLTTVDTGIGLRNRHMRDNYLETDKYRMTNFEGRLTSVETISDNEYQVIVEGKMFIHGVTKQLQVEGKIFKTENGFHVQANFPISLPNYNIEVPSLMFMKINEVMDLHLDFYLEKVN